MSNVYASGPLFKLLSNAYWTYTPRNFKLFQIVLLTEHLYFNYGCIYLSYILAILNVNHTFPPHQLAIAIKCTEAAPPLSCHFPCPPSYIIGHIEWSLHFKTVVSSLILFTLITKGRIRQPVTTAVTTVQPGKPWPKHQSAYHSLLCTCIRKIKSLYKVD